MWKPRQLKLVHNGLFYLSDQNIRLVKFQLPRSPHFGFRAFKSFRQFFIYPFIQSQILKKKQGRVSITISFCGAKTNLGKTWVEKSHV